MIPNIGFTFRPGTGVGGNKNRVWFLATGVIATGFWRDSALWTSTDIYNAGQLWAGGQWDDTKPW